MNRLDYFLARKNQNRFWWFITHNYLPDLYANLTPVQFNYLTDWFEASEKAGMVGEINIPAMTNIVAFINGSGIQRIVQLGHYAGYSSLFIGWALEKSGGHLISVDINQKATNFTKAWLEITGLEQWVTLITGNSVFESTVKEVYDFMPGGPQMVIIDSSHQYAHTLTELNIWYRLLAPGGLILLHDISKFATRYDKTGKGGVNRALLEWRDNAGKNAEVIMINKKEMAGVVYDGCGLGIIQK